MQKRFCEIICSAAIIFLTICCSVVYAGNTLKSCPPNTVVHRFVNNVQEISTNYDELKRVDITKLSPNAKQQFLNTIAVYDNCDETSKMKFIAEFPDAFKNILEIFQSKNFSQFDYAIGTIFEMLGFIAKEYPDQCVNLLVSLSSEAKYELDEPGSFLHYIFINFFVKNSDLTILNIKQLSISKQKNIASFLADVEAIENYPEYESILNVLKNRHETKLYDMFLEAKENKVAELKREHM